MNLFRTDLSDEGKESLRQWARDNYNPFEVISGVWHPVIQHECAEINTTANMSFKTEVSK